MFDTGGFQLGDWVIIHSYNDYQNGQEGEKIKELKPC